jgi:hypothetical protein
VLAAPGVYWPQEPGGKAMETNGAKRDDLFAGLHVLLEATFPKRCQTCGREYADAAEFLAATRQVRPNHTGLKQGLDNDGHPVVDVFRNCACGSTLLESFYNRRDLSPEGVKRRERFDELLAKLVAAGVESGLARAELRKLMRGEPNTVFDIVRALKEAK